MNNYLCIPSGKQATTESSTSVQVPDISPLGVVKEQVSSILKLSQAVIASTGAPQS